MKKIPLYTIAILALATLTVNAADWDSKGVSEVVEKLKAGKRVEESRRLMDQAQLVEFVVAGDVIYYIDYRAKLCFIRHSPQGSLVPVSCKALKDGYPLFAPVIDWEK